MKTDTEMFAVLAQDMDIIEKAIFISQEMNVKHGVVWTCVCCVMTAPPCGIGSGWGINSRFMKFTLDGFDYILLKPCLPRYWSLLGMLPGQIRKAESFPGTFNWSSGMMKN